MVVQLRKCCCCCGWNVRTCTIVIGVLSLVHSSIVFLIALIYAAGMVVSHVWSHDPESGHLITWLFALFGAILIVYLLKIILDSILLVGASKKRPGMVKSWIVFSVIELILAVLGGMVHIILRRYTSECTYSFLCFINIFPLLIYIPLRIYFIFVVNSFHTQLITNFTDNLDMPPMNGYEEKEFRSVKNHRNFV